MSTFRFKTLALVAMLAWGMSAIRAADSSLPGDSLEVKKCTSCFSSVLKETCNLLRKASSPVMYASATALNLIALSQETNAMAMIPNTYALRHQRADSATQIFLLSTQIAVIGSNAGARLLQYEHPSKRTYNKKQDDAFAFASQALIAGIFILTLMTYTESFYPSLTSELLAMLAIGQFL